MDYEYVTLYVMRLVKIKTPIIYICTSGSNSQEIKHLVDVTFTDTPKKLYKQKSSIFVDETFRVIPK